MSSPEHAKRKHALLSASGADRWLNCPPSARLEDEHGAARTTSIYADEGTLAHELADIMLRKAIKNLRPSAYSKAYRAITAHELYDAGMDEEVEKFTDYVLEQLLAAKKRDKTAELFVEQQLDLSEYIPEGFGTIDAFIIADGEMEIIDLKYGKGVAVDAVDNPQLRVYALGALMKFSLLYDITSVRMTIVQPRLDSITRDKMPAPKLLQWGEETLKPAAETAWAGKGDLNPGDHCKWCRVKARCPALAEHVMGMAKHDFAEPALLSDEALVDVYERAPRLADWVNAVTEHMLTEALKGKDWPGYKVVEGRSKRRWANEDQVKAELMHHGYKKDQFMVSKLQGIGNIEKLVGKLNFTKWLSEAVIKPPGKPTLVPETDKRPAVGLEQAKEDFK